MRSHDVASRIDIDSIDINTTGLNYFLIDIPCFINKDACFVAEAGSFIDEHAKGLILTVNQHSTLSRIPKRVSVDYRRNVCQIQNWISPINHLVLVCDRDRSRLNIVFRQLDNQSVKAGETADRGRSADMNQAIVSATFILLPTVEICACSAPHNSVADQVQLIVCSSGIGTTLGIIRISINGSGITFYLCVFDDQHIT